MESDPISKWFVDRELQKQWVEQYTNAFFTIFLTFHFSFCDLFLWNRFNEWRAFNKALSWLEIDFCFKAMVLSSILCLSNTVCFCIVTRDSSVFCRTNLYPMWLGTQVLWFFFPCIVSGDIFCCLFCDMKHIIYTVCIWVLQAVEIVELYSVK